VRALIFRALVVLVAAGFPLHAWAETIERVTVDGNQRIESETIRSYMTIHVGDQYDPEKVDNSLKALFATGLFGDVSIAHDPGALTVHVAENPIINKVAFEGNRKIGADALKKEVQLQPRMVFSRARVQSDVQRIIELYRRSGRFAATVEPKIIKLSQNRVNLVFEISEGDVTKVRGIEFIGNKHYSDNRLAAVIATKQAHWWRFFSGADTYDPDRLTYDREALRRFYLSEGYADFRVVSAVADLTRDRRAFYITFTIEEGNRYKFGEVKIKTALKQLHAKALAPLVETKTGTTFNADQINKTVDALTYAAGEAGYAFVDIRPEIHRDRKARTVAITYDIVEGPRVYVERINISGNVRTREYVIRREFRLAEGDAFNTAKLDRSKQRINALGFFNKVDVSQEQGSAPDRTVVDVEVEEKSTGEFSLGAGFSTSDAVLGEISITERNLLGRGQYARIGLLASFRRQEIDLSFTEPYFLGRHQSAGFDIYRTRTDFQDESSFDSSTTGLTLRTGLPLSEHLTLSGRYTLRNDRISNVDHGASILIKEAQGSELTSSLGYRLSYDRRNDPTRPTKGFDVDLHQDFAGVGGSVRYIRSEISYESYYPITDNVIASLRLSDGYIFGLGQDVHITDRFFRGGSSFRGFDIAGIGPRDLNSKHNDALGGNAYYQGTAEISFPLGLPKEFGILGSVFTDVGSLWDIDKTAPGVVDDKGIRASVGVGIFWESPFGPVRVDFAKAVKKERYDETQFFRFNVGTRF
jgi:outer membrane protein insertion porin family